MTVYQDPARPWLDDLAELYDDFIGAMDGDDNPTRIWLLAQLTGGGRALDIGCGNGRNCRAIADRYTEVVGVDVSPRVLEVAEGKDNPPNVRFECHDVKKLTPDLVGTFDVVYATNGVFTMGDVHEVLPVFKSLIAPGGKLVVLDPTRPYTAPADARSKDETRQSFYPFQTAHTIYELSGDVERAIAAIRYMLHPTWREMNKVCIPLSIVDYEAEYDAVFPGVQITPNVVPNLSGAVWTAPRD